MLENGFIKLHRKILKWEWYDDPYTFKLFMHLMLTANIEDDEWHGVTIPRGSRVSSYDKLASELHFTKRQIRTHLARLELTGEVTHASTRNYSVFSVVNYDFYQTTRHTKRQTKDIHSGKAATHDRQQNKKEKESQEDKEKGGAVSGAEAPSSAPREKSIYERMQE